jgi:hypothetical protein
LNRAEIKCNLCRRKILLRDKLTHESSIEHNKRTFSILPFKPKRKSKNNKKRLINILPFYEHIPEELKYLKNLPFYREDKLPFRDKEEIKAEKNKVLLNELPFNDEIIQNDDNKIFLNLLPFKEEDIDIDVKLKIPHNKIAKDVNRQKLKKDLENYFKQKLFKEIGVGVSKVERLYNKCQKCGEIYRKSDHSNHLKSNKHLKSLGKNLIENQFGFHISVIDKAFKSRLVTYEILPKENGRPRVESEGGLPGGLGSQ